MDTIGRGEFFHARRIFSKKKNRPGADAWDGSLVWTQRSM